MKKLLLPLLFVAAFTGKQIQSKELTLYNDTDNPIFVKNVIQGLLFETGDSGIIDPHQSKKFNSSYNSMSFRIFNNTSNTGPYLFVSIYSSGLTRVKEYNSSGTKITGDYYAALDETTDNIFVSSSSTACGLRVTRSKYNATIFNDTSKEIFATNENGTTKGMIQNNHNALGFKAASVIKIFNAETSSGAYLQLNVQEGTIYVVEFDAAHKPTGVAYNLSFKYGYGFGGTTKNPYISVKNSTSTISGLEVASL